MQRQGHRPWSFEENSILWPVVFRPFLSEEAIKEASVYTVVCMLKRSELVVLYE